MSYRGYRDALKGNLRMERKAVSSKHPLDISLNLSWSSLACWRYVTKRRQWKRMTWKPGALGWPPWAGRWLQEQVAYTSMQLFTTVSSTSATSSAYSRPFPINRAHFTTLEKPKVYTLHVGLICQGSIYGNINISHFPVKITANH